MNNATKIVIRRGSPGVIYATRLTAMNNATKIVIRQGSPEVIHATRLIAMNNATKIVIRRGSPGIIHASRLTKSHTTRLTANYQQQLHKGDLFFSSILSIIHHPIAQLAHRIPILSSTVDFS